MIYLDFDGVLVNSAKESFRLLMYVKQELKDLFSTEKDYQFDHFLIHRSDVGPAWNYNRLYKSIKNNVPFLCANSPNDEDKYFEKDFFLKRSFFKNKHLKKWINLHEVYNFSFLLTDLVERKIIKLKDIIILTNKDPESVISIIRQLIPALSNVKVVSMTQYDYQYTKADFIKENLPRRGKHYFIDDCLSICNDVAHKIKDTNLQIYLADWGYAKSFIGCDSRVKVVSEQALIKNLDGD
jgi:hypothetical protein